MSVTPAQIAIVKSTVPILETGGETLTRHFYQKMFGEHPTVKVFFNQTHQMSGTQQRALANAVLQYAKFIDNLGGLGDLPAQIIQKHVSLNIPAEGYAIVGECLLASIREVLGAEVATDEVIEAWKQAYLQLAKILIDAEESIYAQRAAQPGGWRGKRSFVLWKKEVETPEVTSFYWKPEDGKSILDFVPGQFVGIALNIPGQEFETRRNYSLSDAPNGEYYRMSIKREQGGLVSNHLHDKVNTGDKIDFFPPAGHFLLTPSTKPLVLISAGIGLTPTLSMLNHALENPEHKTRKMVFIHCTRNASVHAFHAHLKALADKHSNLEYYFSYEDAADAAEQPHHVGRINADVLNKWLPTDKDLDAYFLGPKPFMGSVKYLLKHIGIPDSQAKYEFFGPSEALQEPTCPFAGKTASAGKDASASSSATCPFSGVKTN
jgi:nitric oxide dioxygenase